jgi:hypothetical protein
VGRRVPQAVGSDPGEFPPDFLAAALPLVPVLRRGRPLWYPDLPLAQLAAAPFPKLVVSGGHSAGFDAICDDHAERIGASRAVVEGAGHEIQFAGTPINDTLLAHGAQSGSRPHARDPRASPYPATAESRSRSEAGSPARRRDRTEDPSG